MRALIFDLDGTLVDTVYAHVFAWQRALLEGSHPVDGWRIHRRISSDPAIPPRIALPGVREEADVARLAEGYRIALELANRHEVRRLVDAAPPADPGSEAAVRRAVVESYYSIPHTVGTCRMGPSAANGDVVDDVGRVHGVSGLSVIDASIIPEPTAGFPHLVTIMLADHVAERRGADPLGQER
jgi:choline dehydrogenase